MGLETIIIILVVLLLLGALPVWGYSNAWGYKPVASILTIVLVVWLLTLIF